MHLFIWRHAEAEDDNAEGDLARRLTPRGHVQAAQAAEWIRNVSKLRSLKPEIVCSPAVRTRETADALSKSHEVAPSIAPDTDPAAYLPLIERAGDALVIVGHQPTVGRVIAQLLTGNPGYVSVRKGSVWWFQLRHEARSESPVVLRGMFAPD